MHVPALRRSGSWATPSASAPSRRSWPLRPIRSGSTGVTASISSADSGPGGYQRVARARAAQRAGQGAGAGRGEDRRDPQAGQDGRGRGRTEHGQQDADGPPEHRPGGDHCRQAGQRGQRERAGQRHELLPGDRDVLRGQRPGRGEDGVRPGLADGEHDQAGADRAGQQHQAELPTHLSAAHPRRSRSGHRCGRPRRPGRP